MSDQEPDPTTPVLDASRPEPLSDDTPGTASEWKTGLIITAIVLFVAILSAALGGIGAGIVWLSFATVALIVLGGDRRTSEEFAIPFDEIHPEREPFTEIPSADFPAASATTNAPGPSLNHPDLISTASVAVAPRPSVSRAAIPFDRSLLTGGMFVIPACLLAWMLLFGLASNPPGIFCDEVQIGLATHSLLFDQLPSFQLPLFYDHFAYRHLGALPLYAGAPFQLLFGVSTEAIRIAAAFWALMSAGMLVLLVRRIGWRFGEIGIAAFLFSPVFIHYGRINFAQAPSLFAVCFGLFWYVRALETRSWSFAALAGASLGMAIYGNGAYYVAIPVILVALFVGEFVVNRFRWREYRVLAIAVAALAVSVIPIVIHAATQDDFMRRFDERQFGNAPLFSVDRLELVLSNYPEYYSIDYLFRLGETGMPGASILRHSVPGAGTLMWAILPLVVLGMIATYARKDPMTRRFGSFGIAMFLLYPLPDAISAPPGNPPYTLAVFSTMIWAPLLAALGVSFLVDLARETFRSDFLARAAALIVLVAVLVPGYRFYTGPYERYPDVAAGYDGWQYGAVPAVEAFIEREGEYDRFLLDGNFNEAFIFLDYFLLDHSELRSRSVIGGLETAELKRHELIAVRAEYVDRLMSSDEAMRRYIKVEEVIRYPNGEIVMYLIDKGEINDSGRRDIPF